MFNEIYSTEQTCDESERIRKIRPQRFRVVVCGRANAGKTTILRRICNATEDSIPMINWEEVSVSFSYSPLGILKLCPFEQGTEDALQPTEDVRPLAPGFMISDVEFQA
jgi:GTPase SAR1 family protein